MFAAILGALAPVFTKIAGNLFPDPADELKRIALEQQLQSQIMTQAAAIEQAAAEVVKTEAASENWLVASWRPITMLTFVALIVAKWLGFTAPGVSEAVEIELMNLVQVGLGGYVIGRSAEKIAPSIAAVLKK